MIRRLGFEVNSQVIGEQTTVWPAPQQSFSLKNPELECTVLSDSKLRMMLGTQEFDLGSSWRGLADQGSWPWPRAARLLREIIRT